MKPWLAALVIAAGGVSGSIALDSREADACGRSMVQAEHIPGVVDKSGVVAIAEVTAATERAATFRIEEALKGPTAGSLVRVDNRTAYTGQACSPYDEPFSEGFRFREGDKKVLVLEKEVDGLWQVGFSSDTAWDIPSSELQPLVQDFWVDQTPKPSWTGAPRRRGRRINRERPRLRSPRALQRRDGRRPARCLSTVVVIATSPRERFDLSSRSRSPRRKVGGRLLHA